MKRLNRFLLIVNLLLAGGFLFSVSAYYLDPENYRIPTLVGFGFPVFTIGQLLFLGIWFYRKRVWMLLPAICLLIGWPQLRASFQLNLLDTKTKHSANVLTVATYNVQRFNNMVYEEEKPLALAKKSISFLKDIPIDIFCFQESFGHRKKILAHTKKITGLKYEFHNPYGNSILSRYPIVGRKYDPLDNKKNALLYIDVKKGADTIRIFNIHLQSLYFGEEQYEVLNNPNTTQKGDIRSILHKVLIASRKRASQAARVENYILKSPYPIILCGDFNDPPTSFAYHKIARHLQDSYVQKGLGIDATFAGPIPGLRIDYIMADDNFNVLSHEVLEQGTSDHYPVISKLELK